MPDPTEVTKNLSNIVGRGLGVVGQGVNSLAQILSSGDEALRKVDGALHGTPPPTPVPNQAGASEEQVAQQVVTLIREGSRDASSTGDPQDPGAASRFQGALRSLFQLPLNAPFEALSDMLPSPAAMLTSGLRDLRGSMALVRLANGMGTLNDVQVVASYADTVVGRVQGLHNTFIAPALAPVPAPETQVSEEPAASPEPPAPEPAPAARRRRSSSRSRGPSGNVPDATSPKTSRRKKSRSNGVRFAEQVAADVNDPQVTAWKDEYAYGDIDEQAWIEHLSTWAAEAGYDSLDPIFERVAAANKK